LQPERIPLDRLTSVRWRRALRAVATFEVGGRAKLLFGALLAMLLAINGLNVVNSYVGRDFMTAIERRSMSGFVAKGLLYVGVFAASTVAATASPRSVWGSCGATGSRAASSGAASTTPPPIGCGGTPSSRTRTRASPPTSRPSRR
jgi:hypothetical protein